ncbi:MAG: hypothetical protein ACPG49_11130, partial [Chitinophagales bacterium]
MKTLFSFRYLLWMILGLCVAIGNTNLLRAQCDILVDFKEGNVIPNECGMIWTDSNDLLQFEVKEVDESEYVCNSEAASCTHSIVEGGWEIENSVVSVNLAQLKNLEKIHLIFTDDIGEKDVELRLFKNSTLLETFTENSLFSIVLNDPIVLQQATHFELLTCGAKLLQLYFTYNCLDISIGDENYCNLLDELEEVSIPTFNQGDLLFTTGGVPVYGEPNYAIGSDFFWMGNVNISTIDWEGNFYATGMSVFVNNALRFDFSVLDDPVNQVRFSMSAANGHPINIQVNGEPLIIAPDIRDVSYVAPNVSLSVTGTNPQIVTLKGGIEEVLIGGVETNISLFCYETGEDSFLEQDYCTSFEGLIPALYGFNDGFAGGDFLFSEDGVDMYLQDYAGTEPANLVQVADSEAFPNVNLSTGKFVFLNTANLAFDFEGLDEQVTELQLGYAWGGTAIYLEVNGETAFIEGNANEIGYEFADGLTLSVVYNDVQENGTLYLEGNINQFSIGSGELWIDNLCFQKVPIEVPLNACLSFDNLYLTLTGPQTFFTEDDFGIEVYNYNGIPISIETYQVDGFVNNSSLFVVNVYEEWAGDVSLMNGGIGFDFGGVGATVTEVIFQFENGSNHVMNLQINDFPLIETTDFFNVDLLEAGFELTVSGDYVTIVGAIEKLVIAGNNLVIDNLCYYSTIEDGVWPGDTNSDGIANNFDLLPIGTAYGSMGNPRINPTLAWIGQAADDWTDTLVGGVNYKHIDCNGDGEILLDDLEGIIQNYGKTHAKNGNESGTPD